MPPPRIPWPPRLASCIPRLFGRAPRRGISSLLDALPFVFLRIRTLEENCWLQQQQRQRLQAYFFLLRQQKMQLMNKLRAREQKKYEYNQHHLSSSFSALRFILRAQWFHTSPGTVAFCIISAGKWNFLIFYDAKDGIIKYAFVFV